MSIARLIASPSLMLIGFCGFAAAQDAPVDLHAGAATTKPAKGAKGRAETSDQRRRSRAPRQRLFRRARRF